MTYPTLNDIPDPYQVKRCQECEELWDDCRCGEEAELHEARCFWRPNETTMLVRLRECEAERRTRCVDGMEAAPDKGLYLRIFQAKEE